MGYNYLRNKWYCSGVIVSENYPRKKKRVSLLRLLVPSLTCVDIPADCGRECMYVVCNIWYDEWASISNGPVCIGLIFVVVGGGGEIVQVVL